MESVLLSKKEYKQPNIIIIPFLLSKQPAAMDTLQTLSLGAFSLFFFLFLFLFRFRTIITHKLPHVPGIILYIHSLMFISLYNKLLNQSVFFFLVLFSAVPGLPVIGNLLQLKEKKPHKTFTKMAHKYGPIFSIKAGSSTIIVLNTAQLAKQVHSN